MTVTLKLHVTLLPDVSAAVQVTVVTPFTKAVPDGGTQVTVTPGQLSLAVGGVKVTASALREKCSLEPITNAFRCCQINLNLGNALDECSVAWLIAGA